VSPSKESAFMLKLNRAQKLLQFFLEVSPAHWDMASRVRMISARSSGRKMVVLRVTLAMTSNWTSRL